MKLLFITGMQKSGTSLLNRMLMQQSVINNPFLPEGKFFWGDNPPFIPVEEPCGKIYQSHDGAHGHYLSESDFKTEDRLLLLERIEGAAINEPILMNKNPYNAVRVAWLKKVFPECKIVAITRNPVANVYSLLKKFQSPEDKTEDGWWGIKPKKWQNLVSQNKVEQCSNQWKYVNHQILENIKNIDLLINYDDLCNHPNLYVSRAIDLCSIDHEVIRLTKCKNFNDEYKIGSRLQSKNKELRKSNSFDLSKLNETLEFPPLTIHEVETIKSICDKTWRELKARTK